MNPDAYLEMSETEAKHWWFVGRRAILAAMIEKLNLPTSIQILEVGCGTGGNLDMLSKFGVVSAFEAEANARAIAVAKTGNRYDIRAGHCPDAIPFEAKHFDLICMFDVLEHIEQDVETLRSIGRLLTAQGRFVITVPAYQWLYGSHDRTMHHRRRYSAGELRGKLAAAGFVSLKMSYFNTLLFPAAVLVRLAESYFPRRSSAGTRPPGAGVNNFLGKLFGAERHFLERFDLPFGISLLCVAAVASTS